MWCHLFFLGDHGKESIKEGGLCVGLVKHLSEAPDRNLFWLGAIQIVVLL